MQLAPRVLLLAALAGAIAGCAPHPVKKPKAEAPPGGILLRGAGATFPERLYRRWFTTYAAAHPRIAINYEGVGSGEGVRRFIGAGVDPDETVDFGASDAAMTDEQIGASPRGAIMLPMTAGSIVLAYNLAEIEGDLRLSRKAYEKIFLGEIKWWNDPLIASCNPGVKLPKQSIAIVVRQDGSGTTYAFTKHLDAISDRWRSEHGPATLVDWPGNAMRGHGNEGVAALIQHSIGSIGYLNYGTAIEAGLRMATLENRDGAFVKPTAQSGSATLAAAPLPENLRVFVPDPSGQDSYPIVTFSWVLLPKTDTDPAKTAAARELFRWCLSTGQQYSPDLGYLPLPASVATKGMGVLNAVATGR